MSTEIIKHTYQLKRGRSIDFQQSNPILLQGEPGFEWDTLKLKIGDGFTPWNALPYIQGESSVYVAPTKKYFPIKGNINFIYKANDECRLYQWNEKTENYEPLTAPTGSDVPYASEDERGIMKLYNTMGNHEDGTMTQKAISDELDDKIEIILKEEDELLVFTTD